MSFGDHVQIVSNVGKREAREIRFMAHKNVDYQITRDLGRQFKIGTFERFTMNIIWYMYVNLE